MRKNRLFYFFGLALLSSQVQIALANPYRDRNHPDIDLRRIVAREGAVSAVGMMRRHGEGSLSESVVTLLPNCHILASKHGVAPNLGRDTSNFDPNKIKGRKIEVFFGAPTGEFAFSHAYLATVVHVPQFPAAIQKKFMSLSNVSTENLTREEYGILSSRDWVIAALDTKDCQKLKADPSVVPAVLDVDATQNLNHKEISLFSQLNVTMISVREGHELDGTPPAGSVANKYTIMNNNIQECGLTIAWAYGDQGQFRYAKGECSHLAKDSGSPIGYIKNNAFHVIGILVDRATEYQFYQDRGLLDPRVPSDPSDNHRILYKSTRMNLGNGSSGFGLLDLVGDDLKFYQQKLKNN